jgi:hypothetical protein
MNVTVIAFDSDKRVLVGCDVNLLLRTVTSLQDIEYELLARDLLTQKIRTNVTVHFHNQWCHVQPSPDLARLLNILGKDEKVVIRQRFPFVLHHPIPDKTNKQYCFASLSVRVQKSEL